MRATASAFKPFKRETSNRLTATGAAAAITALVVVFAPPGCGGEPEAPEPLAAATGAINFTTIFDDSSCSSVQGAILSGMSWVNTIMTTPSSTDPRATAMLDCLRNSVFNWDEDASPEVIMLFMSENIPTHIRCADPLANGLNSDAPLAGLPGSSNGTESITLKTSWVAQNAGNTQQIAGEILTAVARNKGYSAPEPFSGSMPPGPDNFYAYELLASVPERLRACAHEVLHPPTEPASTLVDGEIDRHELEAVLPTNGRVGGSKFEQKCPNNQIAVGLIGNLGNEVDSIGLTCRPRNGGATTETGTSGGTGGTFQRLRCPGSQIMVGVVGRYGVWNDAIGPICAANANRPSGYQIEPIVGGPGGIPYQRLCPIGTAVRALKGRAGSLVNRLQVECQSTRSPMQTITEEFIGTTGTLGTILSERCPGHMALATLDGRSSQFVDRVGGVCLGVYSTCVADANHICIGRQTFVGGGQLFMTAHGGRGGTRFDDFCTGNNQILVGLRVRGSTSVNAIGGVCADLTQWTDTTNTAAVPLTNLPLRGGTGGNAQTLMCNRHSLLIGWDYSVGSVVSALSPVCRNFDDINASFNFTP